MGMYVTLIISGEKLDHNVINVPIYYCISEVLVNASPLICNITVKFAIEVASRYSDSVLLFRLYLCIPTAGDTDFSGVFICLFYLFGVFFEKAKLNTFHNI